VGEAWEKFDDPDSMPDFDLDDYGAAVDRITQATKKEISERIDEEINEAIDERQRTIENLTAEVEHLQNEIFRVEGENDSLLGPR